MPSKKEEKDLLLEFEKFVKEHYHSIKRKDLPEEEIVGIKRCIWYCNISGNIVPELQKYNTVKYHPGGKNNSEKVDGCTDQLYERGYTNYNIYPCGHCIILVQYLGRIFDFKHSNLSSVHDMRDNGTLEPMIKKLVTNTLNCCPACNDSLPGRRDLYSLFNRLNIGTVVWKNIIPKKYLKYLTSEFQFGDIVDTNGYRGFGLYILNKGGDFVKMKTEEYYVILDKQMVKEYGYFKLLTNLSKVSYCNTPEFDLLYIDDNIIMGTDRQFYHNDEDGDPLSTPVTWVELDKKIVFIVGDVDKQDRFDENISKLDDGVYYVDVNEDNFQFHPLMMDNDNFIIPEIMLDPSTLNTLVNFDNKFKLILNDTESIIIGKEEITLTDGQNFINIY